MRITNEQKREAIDVVVNGGLTRSQFEVRDSDTVLAFQFKAYDFHFSITKVAGGYYLEYNTVTSTGNHQRQEDWATTMQILKTWSSSVTRDQQHALVESPVAEPVTASLYEGNRIVSKRFIRIFSQAERAEQLNLDEIAGMGYRKAVEVLIKDYLVKRNKQNKLRIRTMDLSRCIEEYVTDDRLKLLATRSAWLGNDFSHYNRVWKGRTVSNLKGFISLTVRWMDIHEELSKVKRLMPIGRPRRIPKHVSPGVPTSPGVVS